MGHGGTPSSHPELRMTMKTLGDLTVKPWCDLGCPILGKPHLWKAMWEIDLPPGGSSHLVSGL